MFRALIFATALLVSTAGGAAPQSVIGDWEGPLKVGATTLRLVLHIVHDKDDLSASLDSPSQGVSNVPVSEISFQDRKLSLAIDVIAATYTGTLSADSQSIEGTLSQGDQSTPLTFTRVQDVRP
jgi:uncharacterized protein